MRESEEVVSYFPHPEGLFTFEEYRRALLLATDDLESATELAQVLAAPEPPVSQRTPLPPEPRAGPGRIAFPVRGSSISEDTLILLSLLSDELAHRVATYRADLRGRFSEGILDEQHWRTRRDQLRQALLDAGRLPPHAE